MERKVIVIQGKSISYVERNTKADKTVFFFHGNSGSADTWREQLTDTSFNEYRLIAFDLPGHGESPADGLMEQDLYPISTAKHLAEAVTTLENGPYVLAGFSYGTNLIGEMLAFSLKPTGLILIGMCCVGGSKGMDKVFKPSSVPSIFFYNEPDRGSVIQFLSNMIMNKSALEDTAADYFRTSSLFKPAIIKAASTGALSDEIEHIQKMGQSCCIIYGADDQLIYTDYLRDLSFNLFQHKIFMTKGAGHFVHLDQGAAVNSIMKDYLKEVFIPIRVSLQS